MKRIETSVVSCQFPVLSKNLVILSGALASQREADAQSKDPYPHNARVGTRCHCPNSLPALPQPTPWASSQSRASSVRPAASSALQPHPATSTPRQYRPSDSHQAYPPSSEDSAAVS